MTNAWYDGQMVAFDVETTGVDYETDRIVTASVALVGGGREAIYQSWVVNPGIEIPEAATAVHGLTTEKAREEGVEAALAVSEIVDLLRAGLDMGCPLVAYNARFDFTILDREARRYNVEPLDDLIVIDPLVLDKHYDQYRKGKRTLARACEVYRVVQVHAHDAEADAMAAARVAWRLGRETAELRNHSLRWIHDKQVEWAAEQAASLQAYFRTTGGQPDAIVEPAWPVVPLRW